MGVVEQQHLSSSILAAASLATPVASARGWGVGVVLAFVAMHVEFCVICRAAPVVMGAQQWF